MPWKKAWPTALKAELKRKGVSETKLAELQKYSSIVEVQKDLVAALGAAKAKALVEIIAKDLGI